MDLKITSLFFSFFFLSPSFLLFRLGFWSHAWSLATTPTLRINILLVLSLIPYDIICAPSSKISCDASFGYIVQTYHHIVKPRGTRPCAVQQRDHSPLSGSHKCHAREITHKVNNNNMAHHNNSKVNLNKVMTQDVL